MGKVDCCSVSGLDMFFHSDDHGPPHVHVRRPGEWEIRVNLLLTTEAHLEFTVKWPLNLSNPKSQLRGKICAAVVEHREALLKEWGEKAIDD